MQTLEVEITKICDALKIMNLISQLREVGDYFDQIIFNKKECVIIYDCIGCNVPSFVKEEYIKNTKALISTLGRLGFTNLVLKSSTKHKKAPPPRPSFYGTGKGGSWSCGELSEDLITETEEMIPGLKFRINWSD